MGRGTGCALAAEVPGDERGRDARGTRDDEAEELDCVPRALPGTFLFLCFERCRKYCQFAMNDADQVPLPCTMEKTRLAFGVPPWRRWTALPGGRPFDRPRGLQFVVGTDLISMSSTSPPLTSPSSLTIAMGQWAFDNFWGGRGGIDAWMSASSWHSSSDNRVR